MGSKGMHDDCFVIAKAENIYFKKTFHVRKKRNEAHDQSGLCGEDDYSYAFRSCANPTDGHMKAAPPRSVIQMKGCKRNSRYV